MEATELFQRRSVHDFRCKWSGEMWVGEILWWDVGGAAAGGSCGLVCISLCESELLERDLYRATDCPYYRITAVVNCWTPLNRWETLVTELYNTEILPVAMIYKIIRCVYNLIAVTLVEILLLRDVNYCRRLKTPARQSRGIT